MGTPGTNFLLAGGFGKCEKSRNMPFSNRDMKSLKVLPLFSREKKGTT